MNLEKLVRKNIYNLKPYSCARTEFEGKASVYLDANENPMNAPYNRYPDPFQWELKKRISEVKGIGPEYIFIGNGSDEPIDLAIRIFCEPRKDNIVAINPTYGMYEVCADINDVEYRKVNLKEDFSLDADALLAATDENTKLIFLCSPNNPTGNLLDGDAIRKVIREFKGIVIVDEAYVDFALISSVLSELEKYPNLIILQTLSKAWGLAAIRLGMAFASTEIILFFNKVKYPYNINMLTQEFVMEQLNKTGQKNEWVKYLLSQKEKLVTGLEKISGIQKIYPSDANFVLIKVDDPNGIYTILVDSGIIIRNRNAVSLCAGCLRITVGTEDENTALLEKLREIL